MFHGLCHLTDEQVGHKVILFEARLANIVYDMVKYVIFFRETPKTRFVLNVTPHSKFQLVRFLNKKNKKIKIFNFSSC